MAHTSLAMTPEHSMIRVENCALKSAEWSTPKPYASHHLQPRHDKICRHMSVHPCCSSRKWRPCCIGSRWDPMRNLGIPRNLTVPMGQSQGLGQARFARRAKQRQCVNSLDPGSLDKRGSRGTESVHTAAAMITPGVSHQAGP